MPFGNLSVLYGNNRQGARAIFEIYLLFQSLMQQNLT